jgi:LysM repeat protein
MRVILILVILFCAFNAKSQKGEKLSRQEYIDQYKDLAMKEMKRTGIPASITLAQGILESGNGNSRLATKANNHFGIKCHNWSGPSIKHDDDAKNECFRKYKSPEQSYKDHSEFLVKGSRYSSLFELKQNDYKSWAKGLKKAGYATSPTYAKALITLVESNNLQQYDDIIFTSSTKTKRKREIKSGASYADKRTTHIKNRVKYIIADSGDTYEKISRELHLFDWQLPKYNESSVNKALDSGAIVYLQPKRKKAASESRAHTVKNGETIYKISQLYAIKEKSLRSINNLAVGAEPEHGEVVLLRGKVKGDLPTIKFKVLESKDKIKNDNQENSEFNIEFDLGS